MQATSFRRKRHGGFTLVELLVVIAIIGVLVALLLPAVQAAREAARRAQCTNQLKQLGLACHNFHDSFNSIPPVDISDNFAPWAVFILPYIEQPALYNNWNIKKRYFVQAADAGTQLKVFTCPSRDKGLRSTTAGQARAFGGTNYTGPPGYSDYGACQGTTDHTVADGSEHFNGAFRRVFETMQICNGVPQANNRWGNACQQTAHDTFETWNYMANFRIFTDGLTNTLLIGEMHIPLKFDKSGPVWNGDLQTQYRRFAGHIGTQDPTTGRWTTEYQLVSDVNFSGTGYNLRFGSAHPGACNFVMADGSVKAISNTIDFETYHRLSIREDGLPIGAY